jgi:hypothetical protein
MRVAWLALSIVAVAAVDQPEVVETPPLYGIGSVVVGARAVEVTKDRTLPDGIDLRKGGERVGKASVKIGESFEVTDGHHVGWAFKLLAIEGGRARLEVVNWMALLGEKPWRSVSTTEVRSYVTRKR